MCVRVCLCVCVCVCAFAMSPKKVAKTALQATDNESPGKNVRILSTKDTESETNRSIYDNFTKHGYSTEDVDVRLGGSRRHRRDCSSSYASIRRGRRKYSRVSPQKGFGFSKISISSV